MYQKFLDLIFELLEPWGQQTPDSKIPKWFKQIQMLALVLALPFYWVFFYESVGVDYGPGYND
jgi:hypothetical protein